MEDLLKTSHPILRRKSGTRGVADHEGSSLDLKKADSLPLARRVPSAKSCVAAKNNKGLPLIHPSELLGVPRTFMAPTLPGMPPLDINELLPPITEGIKLDEDEEGPPSLDYDTVETGEKEFHLKQKSFLVTYPKCPLDKNEIASWLLEKYKPIKLVVCQETHHKTEGFHLHAFLEFSKPLNIRNPRYFDYKGYHSNICKLKNKKTTTAAAIEYCTKEDSSPFVIGIDLKEYYLAKKQKRKYIGIKLNEGMSLKDLVKEFPENRWDIPVLKKAQDILDQPEGPAIEWDRPAENLWIVGPPRIGKSYWAHNGWATPPYIKASNKWWDGYKGEETVVIDDFRTPQLGQKLLLWGGEYKNQGETKGGHVNLQHKRIIITSNRTIDEVFRGEEFEEYITPIKERFPQVTIDKKTHQLLPLFGDDWKALMNIETLENMRKCDWGLLEERVRKREKWLEEHPNWKNSKFGELNNN